MKWIVIGEHKGMIKLVSESKTPGILPKGAYLTIETESNKFILRVDESDQNEPYSPSPLVVDMNLNPMSEDQKCQNIIYAKRIKDLNERDDGLIDFIKPQLKARLSNQEEISLALGNNKKTEGPRVFLSTLHSTRCQVLKDQNNIPVSVNLPEDLFYHQVLICGKTVSGKTVASKYLAQYFVEEMEGAVLAINVKDVDFLKMDKSSKTNNERIEGEWESLNIGPKGIENLTIYYPANMRINDSSGVNKELCRKTTLNVKEIDPEALIGLIRGISDIGAQNLPNIFRHWQEDQKNNNSDFTFSDFIKYFSRGAEDGRRFKTMLSRGEEAGEITLHSGTYNNIMRNLNRASEFFDNDDSVALDYSDILYPGKMSVINVAGNKGIEFGSILLRHILHRIVEAKSQEKEEAKVPILIIIDEVHQFYNNESTKEALGDIDTICRTGRSQKIGVIFSSQNPNDIPRGLSNVINTKIFFKTDMSSLSSHGISVNKEDLLNLKTGFAVTSIHNLSQVRNIKFPLSRCGVFEEEVSNG